MRRNPQLRERYIFLMNQIQRMMKDAKKGKIINLSSVRGIRGYTGGNSAYAATKGAVELTTKTLALEWAPHNINVNALGPALVITPGTIHIKNDPELAKKYAASIPLGRICTPAEVADLAAYLASDRAHFINGTMINIDGAQRKSIMDT